LPSTIIFSLGLSLPVAMVWGAKYGTPLGQRVKLNISKI